MTIFCISLPWRIFHLGPNLLVLISKLPYSSSSSSAAAVAVAGHITINARICSAAATPGEQICNGRFRV